MKQQSFGTVSYGAICAVILIGLSGCGRVVEWGKETFNQGKNLENMSELGQSHVRSIIVYDQFDTVGMFDALWLSDEVRTIYSNAYASRRGKNEEFKKTLLRRQLEENKHFITFYVLSPFEYPLGESQAMWQVFLSVDNNTYFPIEFKMVELELEYRVMFGKKYSRFKESYCIKFDAKNIEDHFIITANTKKIELCFRSTNKEAALVWYPYENFNEVVQEQKSDCSVMADMQTLQGNA